MKPRRLWFAGLVGAVIAWLARKPSPIDPREIVPDPGPNPPVELHGAGTRPLTAFEKWALSEFVPRVDLDRAVMHVGELPPWANWAIRPNALTVGSDIYFRAVQHFVSPKGLSLLAHELAHVGQFRRGMNVPRYLWTVRQGYSHDSEYEKPAYDLEKRVFTAMRKKLDGIDFGV